MVDAGAPHDCWTTTEGALTRGLPEHLRDAWERLRETAADFGEQRIYASHKSIMFSRRVCYFFVRPRTKDLEVVFFLGRELKEPRVKLAGRPSRKKAAHVIRITHRDEVEEPLTDWLREAYDMSEALSAKPARPAKPARTAKPERSVKRAKPARRQKKR
jgi:hypothetical protein